MNVKFGPSDFYKVREFENDGGKGGSHIVLFCCFYGFWAFIFVLVLILASVLNQ